MRSARVSISLDMTLFDQAANSGLDHAVIDHFGEIVAQIDQVLHRQIHIDADRLLLAMFVPPHPDLGRQFQIADEDMADAARGVRR